MTDGVDEDKRATLRRFAAVGAATPFAKFSDAPDRDSDARDAILGYLSATPGAHFSKIRDDLKLGTGETQHHIRQLLEAGAIDSRRDGDYRRFFPTGRFTPFEQTALGYLRRETSRGMIVEMLRDPDATGAALADSLDVSRPTISKHAGDLADAGLLARDDGYTLLEPERLLVLLLRYADSFDETVEALAADAADLIRVDR